MNAHGYLESLQAIALKHGATLTCARTLEPLNIAASAKSEFHRGVLSCIANLYWSACEISEVRKAALDLGFQPIFQEIEGE